MIKFLFKGILRDRQRSLLPIFTVSIGVFFTVVMSGFLTGIMGDLIDNSANFATGHVKIMTRAYTELKEQLPNDLALLDVDSLTSNLETQFPEMEWSPRIRFGGLIDIPDENGETRAQGPVAGLAIDLLSPESAEIGRLNIEKSIESGGLPKQQGEILISHKFAQKTQLAIGDDVTYFGSTMNGSMAISNFKVAGTVSFGSSALDRGAFIIDIRDAQKSLDMEDAASELLGYFRGGQYDDLVAEQVATTFNAQYAESEDEFAPIMFRLKEQDQLGELIDYSNAINGIFVFVFVFAMSIVLWNMGLLGGLRRYNEFGLRLALGESKLRIFTTLIYEATLIGTIGSVMGTVLGLGLAWYLQEVGLDFGEMTQNTSMMVPSVYRAKITPDLFYIGFIPGLLSMVLGNALAGLGIYKRQTAQLFKELEV